MHRLVAALSFVLMEDTVMRFFAIFFLFANSAFAQTVLQGKIRAIAADAHGKVAVSCSLPESSINCDLDPYARSPMESVFKLPLAVATLDLVEKEKFSLDQQIRFLPSDRILPHIYSPRQDKYPDANVDIPLRELLRLAVSLSDNVAADIVLRVIGGPSVVTSYMKSIGVEGFHLEDGEHGLHDDAKAQYRNWFEPIGAVELLRRISDNSPFPDENTKLLQGWMQDTPTGPHQIKGEVPPGTIVMHKTGPLLCYGCTGDQLPDGSRKGLPYAAEGFWRQTPGGAPVIR